MIQSLVSAKITLLHVSLSTIILVFRRDIDIAVGADMCFKQMRRRIQERTIITPLRGGTFLMEAGVCTDGTHTINVDDGLSESILGKLSFIIDVMRCCTNDACEIDDCCSALNKPAR